MSNLNDSLKREFPGSPREENEPRKHSGLRLKYDDFKVLEKIIEEYNLDDSGKVCFEKMKNDEKSILWKIKTIIRNMESVRLRPNESGAEEVEK